MPLTPDEALQLSPKAVALVAELREALDPDGEGARKITRAEARRIVTVAIALVGAIVVEILD